ncbi:MAG TPA: tRNA (guanine-N7)-methyltransferase, partial [Planctomycetia bacterium]|nr:tRNA (guanine-N7)-methyltransferase [Planctomycetia bacterium]
ALERLLPESGVAEIHCYHPQPYYDPAEVGKRLVTPAFLAQVHRRLAPGGKFFVQTDNPGYWRYIREVAPVFFDWSEQPGPWPDAPKGRTRREIVALRQGLPVYRAWGTPRPGLDFASASARAAEMPAPTFDADRRLRALDAMEREGT